MDSEVSRPVVSIIIVNFNGGEMLNNCLSVLERQTFCGFEVIVVDNGSHDDSMVVCSRQWSFELKAVRLGWNSGYAVANNRGVALAEGEWVALLNSDAFPHNLWLEHLFDAVQSYPDFDFFTSHQIQFDDHDRVDGTGDMYATNGRAWRRDYGTECVAAIQVDDEVFGACGAAAFFRTECFREVGGFDETFFCYFEDVDLSLRLRLAGYRCMHIAKAIVYHVGSATSGGEVSDFSIYYGYRNLVWTYFKSMPLSLLLKNLPAHIRLNLSQIREFSRIGRRKLIWKSKIAALLGLPRIFLFRRRAVQKLCRIPPKELERVLEHDPTAG